MEIPFNHPHLFFEEGITAVKESLSDGIISGDGLNSRRCHKWFGDRFNYGRCLLTPSCTAALEMAALLLGLGPKDQVIVPSFTFVSTANAFALRGVELVFADSQVETPNVSVDDILHKITDRTRAIVVVHYAGIPLDLTPLVATGIPIVEDCAHAIGSIDPLSRQPIGLIGCMSAFSFHQTKNIPIGEGGLLVVNDEKLWERAQIIREKGTNRTRFVEGRDAFYTWHSLGSSFLMSDIDAGFLWANLQHFDEIQGKRRAIWEQYDRDICHSSLFVKPDSHISLANAHMYYLKFGTQELQIKFISWMKRAGVYVATHYLPLDQSPFICGGSLVETSSTGGPTNQMSPSQKNCSQSRDWQESLVRLPLFFDLTPDGVGKVVRHVNEFSETEGFLFTRMDKSHFEAIRAISESSQVDVVTHSECMELNAETYRVAVHQGVVVGYVGHFNLNCQIACAEEWRGRGVSHFMWNAFVKEFPNIIVKVKRDDSRSLAFFQEQGLVPDPK